MITAADIEEGAEHYARLIETGNATAPQCLRAMLNLVEDYADERARGATLGSPPLRPVIESLRMQLDELREQCDGARRERDSLREERNAARLEKERLRGRLESCKDSLASHRAAVRLLEGAIDGARKALNFEK